MTEIVKRVDQEVVVEINRLHALAEGSYRTAIVHAVECGRLLCEAKERVNHGEWLPWLAEHFEGSHNLASDYMRLARNSEAIAGAPSIDAALKAIAKPAREPRVSDGKLRELLPGLREQEPPHVDGEAIEEAIVLGEHRPAILDATQHGKWDTASTSIDSAHRLLTEASSDDLAPLSVAGAVRDASHELRKGVKALEELAVLIEVQHRRQAA